MVQFQSLYFTVHDLHVQGTISYDCTLLYACCTAGPTVPRCTSKLLQRTILSRRTSPVARLLGLPVIHSPQRSTKCGYPGNRTNFDRQPKPRFWYSLSLSRRTQNIRFQAGEASRTTLFGPLLSPITLPGIVAVLLLHHRSPSTVMQKIGGLTRFFGLKERG